MRSPKGLLLFATLALLFITGQAWGVCPDGPDCLWVDQTRCGQCAGDLRDCESNADCSPAPCSGVCSSDGVTDCTEDADCSSGNCVGFCADGVTACFGDGGCAICNGSTAGSGTQADPFCLVNEAYQVAAVGDTIYVGPGVYKQCVDISPLGVQSGTEDRPVNLLAQAYDESPLDPDSIDETTFDGTDLCVLEPVVTIEGSGSTLTGFTITGGQESGVYVSGGIVTVSHNVLTDNSSPEGGGIAVLSEACNYGGISTIEVSNNEITDNRAEAGPSGSNTEAVGHGGGMHIFVHEDFNAGCDSVSTVTINENVITGNTCKNLNVSSVTGNRFVAKGGGIWITTAMEPGGTANVEFFDNQLTNNRPTEDTPASAGGGIFATTRADGFGIEKIVIQGNVIGPDNRSHEGGGIAAWAISAPKLDPVDNTDHTIEILQNEILGNTGFSSSPEGSGGGVSMRLEAIDMGVGEAVSIDFAQNLVAFNIADSSDGGGLRASVLSERSVVTELGDNTDPADRMELLIRNNTIRNNSSAVGGAGALLLILADSDPVFAETGNCGGAQLPATGSIDFVRNFVANNQAANLSGFTEVGAGILAIPSMYGEAQGTIRIVDSTVAGNTITEDFGSTGGLETLAFADEVCGSFDTAITVSTDRSVVAQNNGYGIGATPPGSPAPADTLQIPVTNSYVFGNPAGNFKPENYPTPPASNFQVDPQLTAAFAPEACSPVFDLKVCEGTTTTCLDNLECDAGPPQVPCLTGVGFHGNPDVTFDSIVDGLDMLELAVSFNSTDSEDPIEPRYSDATDLDHSGVVDGNDLSYMGSQFGQVCAP